MLREHSEPFVHRSISEAPGLNLLTQMGNVSCPCPMAPQHFHTNRMPPYPEKVYLFEECKLWTLKHPLTCAKWAHVEILLFSSHH